MNYFTENKRKPAPAEGQEVCWQQTPKTSQEVACSSGARGQVQNLDPQTYIGCGECCGGACPVCSGNKMEGGIRLVWRGEETSHKEAALEPRQKGYGGAWQVGTCRKEIPGRGNTVSKGLRHSCPWLFGNRKQHQMALRQEEGPQGRLQGWERPPLSDKEPGHYAEEPPKVLNQG